MGGTADTATIRAASHTDHHSSGRGGSLLGSALSSSGLLLLKFLCALALIPMCLGFSEAFTEMFFGPVTQLKLAMFGPNQSVHAFWSGVFICSGVLILVYRPITLYVFLHELTHALATWLCLGKVTGLAASAKGGQVTTSKTNTLIRLAPYCFPTATVLVASLGWLVPFFGVEPANWAVIFAGLLGAAHVFHVGYTLWSLRRDQPDLLQDGWFFSLTVIWLTNIIAFAAVQGLAFSGSFPEAWETTRNLCSDGWGETVSRYNTLMEAFRSLWIQ